jgi:hypothetical protein
MFEADTPGFFEKTEIDIPKHELAVEQAKATWVLPKNTINEGFISIRKRFFSTNSKEVELVGKLHLDLASTPKYYLNLIEVEIALTRANEIFYLIGDSNVTDKYVVNIKSARLHSRVVAINPDIGLAHTTGFLKANAIYPYEHVIVNSTPIVQINLLFQTFTMAYIQMPFTLVLLIQEDLQEHLITILLIFNIFI